MLQPAKTLQADTSSYHKHFKCNAQSKGHGISQDRSFVHYAGIMPSIVSMFKLHQHDWCRPSELTQPSYQSWTSFCTSMILITILIIQNY